MTQTSTFKKIGFASFIMMASVFASRIIGLVRETAIAWMGGASVSVDAYQVAFVIPEILNHVVASGFLSITFIPIFTRYLVENREQEGYRVFSVILNCFGAGLVVFIGFSMIFAPELISILAPGLKNGPAFDLSVRMTRIIIPAQLFFFAGGLFNAVQYSKERFLYPALSPLIYNTGIIAGGILLYPVLGMEGFAWGVLAGAFCGSFLLQLFGAKKVGLVYVPSFNFRHPDVIKYVLLTVPLMLGLTMTFSTEILMKFFGSFLSEGSISAMNYALRIMFILVGLFGNAVGVASYPFMAKLAAKKDFSGLNAIINQTLKYIFIVMPFSVVLMILNKEVVAILFQRGAFDAHDAALTSGVLPYFMAGAFAFSAQTIVSRGFFAVQNTLFPAVFSSVCVGLSLPLLYFAMTAMGINGVALGLSMSVIITTGALFEVWSRRTQNTGKTDVYTFFGVMLLVSIMVWGILKAIYVGILHVIPISGLFTHIVICLIVGTVFLIILAGMGKIFKIREISSLYTKVLAKTGLIPKRA
ncbi:murein biosynthesis integral membrane protein MurJ [uncultured Desulfobacter sp.]|uniref:murein biosynthesis integral membrane protein MurJ n=1 Tax=uncultured Desulfobacter sp. TaxID=240139 RepID=UPI002AAA9C8A|nr:murein biosynthesis integral membrane protein MurJ [uncultured Desulfobacter sp.]